jgi:rubredoxin
MANEAKYVCNLCGYEYDGSDGPFEGLADDWVCPLCGAPKSDFTKQ